MTKKVALSLLSLSLGFNNCSGQGSYYLPPDPREANLILKIDEFTVNGMVALAEKRNKEAITAFREAARLEEKLVTYSSRAHYAAAKALASLNHDSEALQLYKKAIRWNPKEQDLECRGPERFRLSMDYAMLLAKNGRMQDAKTIYYWGLRFLGENGNYTEPIPFVFVFDPDDTCVFIPYTVEKFTSVALLLQAVEDLDLKLMETIAKHEPDWLYPLVYIWNRQELDGEKDQKLLDKAMKLATTDRERKWLDACKNNTLPQNLGKEIRSQSEVLKKAKADLVKNYKRVAISSSKK